jgi:chaperone modulatory protein CbpM
MAGAARLHFTEVVARTRASDAELTRWVELKWVRPARAADEPAPQNWMFSDADLARVELICDLAHDMAIDAGAIEVILPLLDQVYALRRDLRGVMRAVEALPQEARETVLRQIGGKAP